MADVEIRLKFIRENIAAFKQTIDEIQSLNTAANKPLKADAKSLIAELKKVKDEAQKAGDELEKLAAKRIRKPKVDVVQDTVTSPVIENTVTPITRSIKEAAEFANAEVAKLKAQAKTAAEDILKTVAGAEAQAAQLRLQASSNPIKIAADLANKEAELSKATAARIVDVAKFNASTAVLNAKDIAESQQALAISAKAALENNSLLGRFRALKTETGRIVTSIRSEFAKIIAEEKALLSNSIASRKNSPDTAPQASGGIAQTVKGFIGAQIVIEAFNSAISAAKQQFQNFLDKGNDLVQLSDKTGLTIDRLSALQFAATQNNTTLDGLGASLRGLSINLQRATLETGPAAEALRDLGLNAEELKKVGLEKSLLLISNEIRKFVPEDQISIAKALGIEASLPLLKLGEDGINKMTDKARELGLVASTEAAQGANKLKDKLNELKDVTNAKFFNAFSSALPEINKLVEKISEIKGAATENGGAVGAIIRTIFTQINEVVDAGLKIGDSLRKLLAPLESIFLFFAGIVKAVNNTQSSLLGVESPVDRIRVIVLFIKDTLDNFAATLLVIGGAISLALTGPFGLVAEIVGNIVRVVSKDLGESIIAAGKAAIGFSENMVGAGKAAFSADGEVKKLKRSLEDARTVKIDPFANTSFANQGGKAPILDSAAQQALRLITPNKTRPPREGAGGKEKDTLASRIALAKAELQAEFTQLEAVLKAANATIEQSFADGLISIEDAYNSRLEFIRLQDQEQRKLFESEAELFRNGIAEALKKKDEGKANQLKAQLVAVEAKLFIQEVNLKEQQDKLAKWKKDQEFLLKDLQVSIALDLAEISGTFNVDATVANIQKQFSSKRIILQTAIDTANRDGDLSRASSLENSLRALNIKEQTSIAQEKLNALLAEQDRITISADRQLSIVQENLQRGKIGEIEANLQIEAIQARLINNLEPVRAKLAEAAQAFPSEAAKVIEDAGFKVEDLGRKIEAAKPQIVTLGQTLSNTFQSGLGNALADSLLKVRSLKEGIIDMVRQAVAAVVRSNLIKLLGSIGSSLGFSNSGLVPTDASAAAGYYASGGHIRGAGTGTSDSIPAWLSNGEFVIPANRVQQYGVGFFEALRQGVIKNVQGGFSNLSNTAQSIRSSTATLGRYAAGGLAMASGLNVQLLNNGTPQRVVSQDFDLHAMVVRIVTEDVKRGGSINNAIEQSGRRRK